MQYLVHWKGYPDSENSWLPAKELTHAKELLQEFKTRTHPKEGIRVLQAQQKPKEGILSRTKSASTRSTSPKLQKSPSPIAPAPKPSYSQVVKKPPRDPEKVSCEPTRDLARGPTRDSSRDTKSSIQSRDITARDPGNLTRDLQRDWSRSQGQTRPHFRCATHPLINTWKTVGTINEVTRLEWLRSAQHSNNRCAAVY